LSNAPSRGTELSLGVLSFAIGVTETRHALGVVSSAFSGCKTWWDCWNYLCGMPDISFGATVFYSAMAISPWMSFSVALWLLLKKRPHRQRNTQSRSRPSNSPTAPSRNVSASGRGAMSPARKPRVTSGAGAIVVWDATGRAHIEALIPRATTAADPEIPNADPRHRQP
jgi:hypothetical protein